MTQRFTYEETDTPTSQPGVLQYGLFVTMAESKSGHSGSIWVRAVTRHGDLGTPNIWRLSQGPVPRWIVEDLKTRVCSMLEHEITHRRGIQEELPQ